MYYKLVTDKEQEGLVVTACGFLWWCEMVLSGNLGGRWAVRSHRSEGHDKEHSHLMFSKAESQSFEIYFMIM